MMVTDFRTANICIIGGKGRMGRWFETRFREAGMASVVADLKDGSVSDQFIASFDVVMLAVPVPAVDEVMKTIGSYIRPDAVIMDISSLKRNPVNSMLKYSQCEVIGTHPLWGPSATSFADQVIFLCPERTKIWIGAFRRFLEEQGTKVIEIEPDKHDKLMACVQTLRHVMLTALGQTLMKLGFDLECDTEASGPWFQELLGMMRHQFEQPSELYSDLAIENEYAARTLNAFQQSLSQLTDLVSSGNRAGLINAMDEVAHFCAIQETTTKNSSCGWWRDIGGDSRHVEV
ncbi:MAG: prephenate dehydrogenase/arogenate dehydrogenase family protein [Deltaproteobacteria bacterium]|nr:prephenate dehydrogenase/arogenate dehydrogenase family protein [Deltaproteobacteria bacterium]